MHILLKLLQHGVLSVDKDLHFSSKHLGRIYSYILL